MATTHALRTGKKTKPSAPPAPQPQPAAEASQPPQGRTRDWIALVVWVSCAALMAGLVLFDTFLGLFR